MNDYSPNPRNMVSFTLYYSKFIEAKLDEAKLDDTKPDVVKLDEAKEHEKKVNKCVHHLYEKYNTAYQNRQYIGINWIDAIKQLDDLNLKKEKITRLLHSNSSKPKNNKKLVQSKLDKVNADLQIVINFVNYITNEYNFAFQQVQDIDIKIGYALNSSKKAAINRKELEDKLK
jgi:hypothetical protein